MNFMSTGHSVGNFSAFFFFGSLLQSNGGTKRQKISHQNYIAYQKQVIRRSMRHRKVRGEKALLVSANQTLKELKIQVRRV